MACVSALLRSASRAALPARHILGASRVCAPNVQKLWYSTDLPEHIVVQMPALSPTMEMGTLVQWNVQVGEEVAAGDSLGEIETDKATMSFDSAEDGYVAKFLVEAGTADIPLGTPVVVMCEEEDDVAAFAPTAAAPQAAPAAPEPTAAAAPAPTAPPATSAPAISVAASAASALDASLYAAAKAAFDAKYPTGLTI